MGVGREQLRTGQSQSFVRLPPTLPSLSGKKLPFFKLADLGRLDAVEYSQISKPAKEKPNLSLRASQKESSKTSREKQPEQQNTHKKEKK